MTQAILQLDLSSHPHNAHAECWMPHPPSRLYRTWTQEFGVRFARSDSVVMDAKPLPSPL